jgi:transposase-like protein
LAQRRPCSGEQITRLKAASVAHARAAIRLVVMMYVRFPLSVKNVEDLLFERGIDICHETVRMWWNRFPSSRRRAARRAVDGR